MKICDICTKTFAAETVSVVVRIGAGAIEIGDEMDLCSHHQDSLRAMVLDAIRKFTEEERQ